MNLLAHYITVFKIIRRLSKASNNLYRIIPLKLFFNIKTRKWIKVYNKKTVKTILNISLGDFLEYSAYCTDKEAIIDKANDVLDHKFDLLGSGQVILEPIDWHKDFKSGYRWPKGKFYKDYVQVDLTNNADVKVPRELSRSHHLLWLGQAYLITDNENYADEVIYQIDNWIDENPVMYSINWGCAMDVAIRAVNWLYALNMINKSKNFNDEFTQKVLISLYEHGFYIFRNLEKGASYSGNHYASNLTGLLFLGRLFHNTKEGHSWFEEGLKEYYKEIRNQVLPSGVYFERSTSYHRLVTELFFYPYLMLKRVKTNVPLDIRYRLKSMFEYILYYMHPDGKAPLIGDEDNGQLLDFNPSRPKSNHLYLVNLAAVEYSAPFFKKKSENLTNEIFFAYGKDGVKRFLALPENNIELKSKILPDAGIAILRTEKVFLFINNGGATKFPDLLNQSGSHAHADLLSFELAYNGVPFLIDPGTYVYTSNPEWRNKFRGTQMHNTVMIDGQNQHFLPKDDLFSTKNIALPVDFKYKKEKEKEIVTVSHNGYSKLKNPVIHYRTFILNNKDHTIEIIDKFEGNGEHEFEWNFHFGNSITIEINDSVIIANHQNIKMLSTMIHDDSNLKIEKLNEYYSPSYGIKKEVPVARVRFKQIVPFLFKTQVKFEQNEL